MGSTTRRPKRSGDISAHPHVCGEHSLYVCGVLTQLGSSPRVWGAPRVVLACVRFGRLIPTCVGSTPPSSRKHRTGPAHPHVCGEHWKRFARRNRPPGSSPRVWGALHNIKSQRCTRRLIPTCVGSTSIAAMISRLIAAHPHVCGEHTLVPLSREGQPGSSPRVWGAQKLRNPIHKRARLIPTCVGSTCLDRRLLACSQAHPHVCGEHTC